MWYWYVIRKINTLSEYWDLFNKDYLLPIEVDHYSKKGKRVLIEKIIDKTITANISEDPRIIIINPQEVKNFYYKFWLKALKGYFYYEKIDLDSTKKEILWSIFEWAKDILDSHEFYLNIVKKNFKGKEFYKQNEISNELKSILRTADQIKAINKTKFITSNVLLLALCENTNNKARKLLQKYLPDMQDYIEMIKNNRFNKGLLENISQNTTFNKETELDYFEFKIFFNTIYKNKYKRKHTNSILLLKNAINEEEKLKNYFINAMGKNYLKFHETIIWKTFNLKANLERLIEIKHRKKAMEFRRKEFEKDREK